VTAFDRDDVSVIEPPGSGGGCLRLLAFGAAVPLDSASKLSWRSDLAVEVATYEHALATPLRSGGAEGRRIIGAVYDRDGGLVTDSLRAKHNRVWKDNPRQLSAGIWAEAAAGAASAMHLPGRTFYAGHRRDAFGHFLLETMPRLWPDLDYRAFDTFLYYGTRLGRRDASAPHPAYARDLLVALGAGGPRGVVVRTQPIAVDELVVSTPAFVLQTQFSPTCADVFERVAQRVCEAATTAVDQVPARRVYLSRSRLGPPHRAATNETAVEEVVQRLGFTVVHPQELTIAAQVALVRGADVVAGCDGSALHLAAFARPGTVLVAFDSRIVVNQLMIDQLARLDAVHVLAHDGRTDRKGSWAADLDRVRYALELAGVS